MSPTPGSAKSLTQSQKQRRMEKIYTVLAPFLFRHTTTPHPRSVEKGIKIPSTRTSKKQRRIQSILESLSLEFDESQRSTSANIGEQGGKEFFVVGIHEAVHGLQHSGKYNNLVAALLMPTAVETYFSNKHKSTKEASFSNNASSISLYRNNKAGLDSVVNELSKKERTNDYVHRETMLPKEGDPNDCYAWGSRLGTYALHFETMLKVKRSGIIFLALLNKGLSFADAERKTMRWAKMRLISKK